MEDINFQVIIVIAFLIIGAVRWLIENALGKKRPPEPEHWEEYDHEERADYASPPPTQSNNLSDLYEEARREILERQNRQVTPPPIVQKTAASVGDPPTPALPSKAKPTPTAKPQKDSYQQPEVRRPQLTDEERKALAVFEDLSQEKPKTMERSRSRVGDLLKSPQAARDAIVLTEILGKPKGSLH